MDLVCNSTILTSLGIGSFFIFSLVLNLIINVMFYDTLGFHDLDFGMLQNIGISTNIKIQQCHPYQQEDESFHDPLVVAMARHGVPIKFERAYKQHGRDMQIFMELVQK